MKPMTGREYLSKIRRKASSSPWHTRVTRSAELFIRVPANALIVSLGRLVVRKDEKFQKVSHRSTRIHTDNEPFINSSVKIRVNPWLIQKLFGIDDLSRNRRGGDYVG